MVSEQGERKVKGYILGVPYGTYTARVEILYVEGDTEELIAYAEAEISVERGTKTEPKIDFAQEQVVEYEIEWPEPGDQEGGPPELRAVTPN